ncbi:MAG: hypothetical protein ACO3F9_12300, partial [Burkholderiales bacterium]
MQDTLPSVATALPEGPWNPGLQSQIPAGLLPLATIYRPENTATPLPQARELADLTGLPIEELVVFRPERLVVHELLALVTANLSVEDGRKTEDLGINFRRMADAILTRHLLPQMAEFAEAHDALRTRLFNAVADNLETGLREAEAPPPRAGWWSRLFGKPTPVAMDGAADIEARDVRAIRRWETLQQATQDPLQRAACRALARVAGAMHARHGRLWGDRA